MKHNFIEFASADEYCHIICKKCGLKLYSVSNLRILLSIERYRNGIFNSNCDKTFPFRFIFKNLNMVEIYRINSFYISPLTIHEEFTKIK